MAKKLVINHVPLKRCKPSERPKSPAGIALAYSSCIFLLMLGTLALVKIEQIKVLLTASEPVRMTMCDDKTAQVDDTAEPQQEQPSIEVPVAPTVIAVSPAFADIALSLTVRPLDTDLIPVDQTLYDLAHGEYQEAELTPVPVPPTIKTPARPHRPSAQNTKPSFVSTAPSKKPTKLARYKHTPLPPYPKSARQAGQEGIVVLLIHVNKDGYPQRVTISQPSGIACLDEASVQWVSRNWTFYPAINEKDMPVECDVMAPIRFQLN